MKILFLNKRLVITIFSLGSMAMFLVSCASTTSPVIKADVTADELFPLEKTAGLLNLKGVKPELLVERLSWGATDSSVELAYKIGTAAYLEQQLSVTAKPALPQEVQDRIAAMTISQKNLADIVRGLEQQRLSKSDDARKKVQLELARLGKEAQERAILRAIYSSQQLQEQLVWFWFNHFNVFQGKANLRAMVGDYEERAIRPHVVGKFRDLLAATVHHPAMLRYLDNAQNGVGKRNENLARKILELHTMGVKMGAKNGDYTQSDVRELARILTGVGINLKKERTTGSGRIQNYYVRKGLFEFNPGRHDFGAKQFLGHQILGSGLSELDKAIEIVSRHPATATFVSKKLALFFVGDSPSQTLIDAMAKTFLSTDGDIRSVLNTLFASTEFVRSLGKQFKDPSHYIFSALRLAYGDRLISNTHPIMNWLSRSGQPLYGKLSPKGYALTASVWNTPRQMRTRFEIAKLIGSGNTDLFKSEKSSENKKIFSKTLNLNNTLFSQYISKTLSPATLKSLDQAKNQLDWNIIFLTSPEMMMR